jgi:hypothetical protein
MVESAESALHQQGLTVLGLLTGFMITTLVLILGSPGSFHSSIGPISGADYFQLLATYVALVGVVSVIGMIALLEVSTGWAKVSSRVDQFGYTCFLLSLFGFIGALPLLLAPFTEYGAAIVLVAAVLLLGIYLAFGGMGRSRRT